MQLVRSIVLMLGLLISTITLAQEPKIGYVDTARILKTAPQADSARDLLQKEFAPRDKKIVALQKKLKRLEDRLSSQAEDSSTRNTLERDIISIKRDIKRAREEFTEDFNIRRNEELSSLQKLVYDTIVSLAKDEEYDVIIGDSALYASNRVDITDKVLARLKTKSGDVPASKEKPASK